MNGALLRDAFDHHVWATLRLLDVCLALTPEQLQTTVPGTFGSILDTMRHLVGADRWYLYVLTERRTPQIDAETMNLQELRSAMETNAEEWPRVIGADLDPAAIAVAYRDDGSQGLSPLTVRLAQVTHHGTDHRSQICTALTSLGIEPPDIDLWAFAEKDGRLSEVPAPM